MNDLEMCKAMAELEAKKSWYGHTECVFIETNGLVGKSCAKYNPITDLALNCAMRDKYEVRIDYFCEDIFIHKNDDCEEIGWTSFKCKNDIPRAVIECILKSRGLLS